MEETNLKSIERIFPEKNKQELFPKIIPDRFNSQTEILPYSLVPNYYSPTEIN